MILKLLLYYTAFFFIVLQYLELFICICIFMYRTCNVIAYLKYLYLSIVFVFMTNNVITLISRTRIIYVYRVFVIRLYTITYVILFCNVLYAMIYGSSYEEKGVGMSKHAFIAFVCIRYDIYIYNNGIIQIDIVCVGILD